MESPAIRACANEAPLTGPCCPDLTNNFGNTLVTSNQLYPGPMTDSYHIMGLASGWGPWVPDSNLSCAS
jgi:hypothetical protein